MKSVFASAYRYRGVLMAPPYLVLMFVFVAEVERDDVIWPIGLIIFSISICIRIWAQIYLHYRLPVHKCLTKDGPYAIVRNPIYVANTLMLLGLTVLSELIWFLPVMLLWCVLVYGMVVRREEAHLAEKYGQPYRDYQCAVPRWIPNFQLRGRLIGYGMIHRYLVRSIIAEAHCLLLLVPMIGKELLSNWW